MSINVCSKNNKLFASLPRPGQRGTRYVISSGGFINRANYSRCMDTYCSVFIIIIIIIIIIMKCLANTIN